MLRPSLPMIRPFISSDGSGRTVSGDCVLVGTASRWTAVVTMRRARASAVRRACASARRTCAAASFSACSTIRRVSSARASSAVSPVTDSSSASAARSAAARAGDRRALGLLQHPRARPARLSGRLGLGARAVRSSSSISIRSVAADCSRSRQPLLAPFDVLAHRACRVLDGGDVRLGAGALQAGLPTGDEDEHEGHEAGAEQPDDRAGGACVHNVLLVRPRDAQRCRCAGSGHCRAHLPPFGRTAARARPVCPGRARKVTGRPRRTRPGRSSAAGSCAASSSRTSRATSPGGYPRRPSAANVRRDRVCASSPEVEASLRRTSVRAADSSSSASTCSSASPATSSSIPRRRSSTAIARRDSPRSACRVRTTIRAYSASSISPTSVNRSSTRSATSSGTSLRAIASASCARLRGERVRSRSAIARATDSWSGSASCAAAPVEGGSVPNRPRRRVPLVIRAAQKSTAGTASAGASTRAPMPSFSLIFLSSSMARSGLSRRKLRAFSLP